MKNTITKSVLVLASTGFIAQAYIPSPRANKPHKDFIERTYIRLTEEAMEQARKSRKKEILANIRSIRRQIKEQSQFFGKRIPTSYIGDVSEINTEVNCSKLMLSIVNNLS